MKRPICPALFGLFFAVSGAVYAQTPPSASQPAPTPGTNAAAPDASVQAYNDAVNAFNKATQDYNQAKSANDPVLLGTAQSEIAANITQLQTLAQTVPYQNNTDKNSATLHNLLGYLYLLQDTPDSNIKAIPELETTVQLTPADLDARNNLGNAYRQVADSLEASSPDKTKDYDAATQQYQYILAHPPANGSPNLDLAKIKFNLATVYGQEGRLDEALALFADLTSSGTADAAVYKNYSYFLQKAGRSAEAAAALRKSGDLNPKDADVWLNAGELYATGGNQDEAIAALTKAVGPDVDPKLDVASEYDAYFALGEAYAAKGDPNQAIKEFDTASQLQPQNAVALYNKGVLQEQAGLKADAETSYRSALKNDPNNVQIQTALGLLLADRGNAAEAISLLSVAAPQLPQDAKAAPIYSRLGDMYAQQKDNVNATQARMQALVLNPADSVTRLSLADSYLAQGQYVSALAQYDLAARANPNDAAIQNQRGVAYKALKQYPKALAAFKRAIVIDPHNAQVENNIGVLDELLGNRAEAIVAYKKALALNPNLAEARLNLNRFSHP